jgi:starch phosphorylase
MWPELPVWEVPITSITNGVHLLSWLNGSGGALRSVSPAGLARALSDPDTWELIDDIPDSGAVGSAPPAQAQAGELHVGDRVR